MTLHNFGTPEQQKDLATLDRLRELLSKSGCVLMNMNGILIHRHASDVGCEVMVELCGVLNGLRDGDR